MGVLHLETFHVLRCAHIVVWPDHQAGPVSREKLLQSLDFLRSRFLLRNHVIKPEHHESVRISEDLSVDRQFLSGLVDPLVNHDRLPGHLADDRLKAHCRQMEQLKGSGNSLQERLLRIFRLLVIRPCDATHLGHG